MVEERLSELLCRRKLIEMEIRTESKKEYDAKMEQLELSKKLDIVNEAIDDYLSKYVCNLSEVLEESLWD